MYWYICIGNTVSLDLYFCCCLIFLQVINLLWAVAPGLSPFVTLRRRTIGGSASTSRSPLGPPSPGMNLDLTFY